MKLIGVTQRVVIEPRYGERRDALDQRWAQFLAACGLGAIPLPNQPDLAIRLAAVTGVDGILFTGGNDLSDYGGDAPERDATEAALLVWARVRKLPVLGVCRGMQMLQHSFGVRLERAKGHVTASHPALVEGIPRDVNSYHNFLARESVPELVVWGRAWDKGIEAVRHCHETIAGMMWHPERLMPFDERDVAFFKNFFGAIK